MERVILIRQLMAQLHSWLDTLPMCGELSLIIVAKTIESDATESNS